MSIRRSIDAINRRDPDDWLDCYDPHVEWAIVGGARWSGHDGLRSMWDAMVVAGSAVKREVEVEVRPSELLAAAVIAHDDLDDGIVICDLDADGRITHGRSYRAGEPAVTPAQTALRRSVVCWNARDRRAWLDGFAQVADISGISKSAPPDATWDRTRTDPRADRLHVATCIGAGPWAAAHLRVRGDETVSEAIVECSVNAAGRISRAIVHA